MLHNCRYVGLLGKWTKCLPSLLEATGLWRDHFGLTLIFQTYLTHIVLSCLYIHKVEDLLTHHVLTTAWFWSEMPTIPAFRPEASGVNIPSLLTVVCNPRPSQLIVSISCDLQCKCVIKTQLVCTDPQWMHWWIRQCWFRHFKPLKRECFPVRLVFLSYHFTTKLTNKGYFDHCLSSPNDNGCCEISWQQYAF